MPTLNIIELMATIQGLQGTIETLVGAMTNQGRIREYPLVEKEPRVQEKQARPQVIVGGVPHVSYLKFIELQRFMFSRMNVTEDP